MNEWVHLNPSYPPGQDLVGGDENLKKTLKQIEVIWDKNKKSLENSALIKFDG